MKAATFDHYGPAEVVKVTEVERPKPRQNEVLIKVKATTVTTADSHIRSMNIPSR